MQNIEAFIAKHSAEIESIKSQLAMNFDAPETDEDSACLRDYARKGENMNAWTIQHLTEWADREFREEDERDTVVASITKLWESDADYFAAGSHSWWELLDMARRTA